MACPKGLEISYKLAGKSNIHIGVIPKNLVEQDYCLNEAIENNICQDHTNVDFIENQFTEC